MKTVLGRELGRSTPLLVLCKHINFLAGDLQVPVKVKA